MVSRTERIDGFYRKVSRTEKEFYELFRKTEEADVLTQMRACFAEARQAPDGIRFNHQELCSRLETAVEAWIADTCEARRLNRDWITRAEEAILHRVRTLMAQALREALTGAP
ncbi:MAG: hypothetical protein JO015_05475 [Verrucomicrobia bacterium]|nr:hypothetical protein [Verrucomicrobiota bacterium]